LGFDENAFKVKWLKKEIAVHFDEDNDEYKNLAALLRMYYEYAPKSSGIRYANNLAEQFKDAKYKIKQIDMFKQLYSVNSYVINSVKSTEIDSYVQDLMILNLRSKNTKKVVMQLI
jgi:hypothetical protein